jgi:uncharacterized protein (UPF0297 family)
MQTEQEIKEMVKQKYSEIALQDKGSNASSAVVQVVVAPKYITS